MKKYWTWKPFDFLTFFYLEFIEFLKKKIIKQNWEFDYTFDSKLKFDEQKIIIKILGFKITKIKNIYFINCYKNLNFEFCFLKFK